MISNYPLERTCAACKNVVTVGEDLLPRRMHPQWLDGAVDGRQGFAELGGRAHERDIEECSRCGHLAPDLSAEYSGLARGCDARAELLALSGHAPDARRCLAVAALFDDEPREEGMWLVRAAWADEVAGFTKVARALRLRAALSLELALHEGLALSEERLGSALLIAECFRIGGAFDRAIEHCARVSPNLAGLDAQAREVLLFEVNASVERDQTPAMRRAAVESARVFPREKVRWLAELMEVTRAKVAPLVLRPARPAAPGEYRNWSGEADAFARGYLDDDMLIQLLATRRIGSVWQAVQLHPRFFPRLLAATDHGTESVRKSAVEALYNHSLDFAADILRGHDDAVTALARRLGDDDPQMVRWAGAIAKQVVQLDPSFARILVDAARTALPRWRTDLPTEGVLERLVGSGDSPS